MDDFLSGTAALFGDVVDDDDAISYGPLVLTVAPKVYLYSQANTLLADHLFSPSLLLSERIERGLIPLHKATVIELGAGCALPSLLSSILANPPRLVAITDYPDEIILRNLRNNVERNRSKITNGCTVHHRGYEWGQDVSALLELLPQSGGYDVVILSDLLHFDASHGELIASLTLLLRRASTARTYIAAGKYTLPHICDRFIREAASAGIIIQEGEDSAEWLGTLEVKGGGLDRAQLGVRKGMCRWWVGQWVAEAFAPSSAQK
ncbi:hypothetical protein B0H21DRAFT_692975 [Amylocystis lapponica]|nr:hypothetical protein B0H21DRAFT_692975 [Amylocystis lapponica]